ncbi:MAG TPA: sigma-70 family RNA polymerase sigma factor [Polyangiaceae bacterium]|nr:sigma-70 family RNA polymerase sigma factor [Polyangiaceae bacterium]
MTVALLAHTPAVPAPVSAVGEIDGATLRAAQGGDRQALERFIRHYERTVFAFLSRSLGHGPEIEDLAQEVFVRAYRALPRFEQRSEARVSTWLLQVAVHLVLDHRKKKRLQLEPLDEGRAGATLHTPEALHHERDLVRTIERAASELPDDQRIALVLADFHGLDMNEIAAATNTPISTVKTRLFRAREQLKSAVEQMRRNEQ